MAPSNILLYILLLISTNSLSLAVFRIFYIDPDGIVLMLGGKKGLLNTFWLVFSTVVAMYSFGGLCVFAWKRRFKHKFVGVEKYELPSQLANRSFGSVSTCSDTCNHKTLTPTSSSSITYVDGFGPSKSPTPRVLSSSSQEMNTPSSESQRRSIPLISPDSEGKYALSGIFSQPTTLSKPGPTFNAKRTTEGPLPLISSSSSGRYTPRGSTTSLHNGARWHETSRPKPTALHIPDSRHYSADKALSHTEHGISGTPMWMSASDVCHIPEPRRPEQAWAKTSPRFQGEDGTLYQGGEGDGSGHARDTVEFRQQCVYDADGKIITLYGV